MPESIEVKRLLKIGQVFLVVLTIFVLATVLYVFKLYSNVDRGTVTGNIITVSGEGEILAIPDVATFSFGVSALAPTVTSAQSQVNDKIAKALGLVRAAGVADQDTKTLDYSVSPEYEYRNPPCTQFSCPSSTRNLSGYRVSQTISVKVRKVEDAGRILESLGTTEVTDVSGLNFTIDDKDALQAQARGMAIEDAREKAKVLAKDLGVRLVRVVNFYEGGNYVPYYMDERSLGIGGDGPAPAKAEIPVGQNRIISGVSVTYEIQ